MNTSTCSSRLPLTGIEEFEGFLPEFGRIGHWSTGSLANWCGWLPASLVASLDSPRCRPGDLVVVEDLSFHGGRPSASFLLVPLPRDFGWVHHVPLTWSCGAAASSSSSNWKAAQLGAVLRGSGGRSWAPLSSGTVVVQPGRVSVPPFGGGRFSEWRLEGEVAGARRSWPVFQCPRKITGSYTGEGLGLTLAPKTLLGDASISTSAGGLSMRLVLEEG